MKLLGLPRKIIRRFSNEDQFLHLSLQMPGWKCDAEVHWNIEKYLFRL
jgi:hypothetical protein